MGVSRHACYLPDVRPAPCRFGIGMRQMQKASAKPFRTACESHAELDRAVHALSSDDSSSRIMFELPAPAMHRDAEAHYNWDVQVNCRPEHDEAAQTAVQFVADK